MGDIVSNDDLVVARNFKALERISAEWLDEPGVKELLQSLISLRASALPNEKLTKAENHIMAACLLCFEEGAYRGYMAGVGNHSPP
jgi:hypothetical protein